MDTLRLRVLGLLLVIFVGVLLLGPTLKPDMFGKSWISKPISLGLDLSGGVHLVYEVQTDEAVKSRMLQTAQAIRTKLRDAKVPVTKAAALDGAALEVVLLTKRRADESLGIIQENFKELSLVERTPFGEGERFVFSVTPTESASIATRAVHQAVETLRNRIDQFGVAEPLIQTSGEKRIVLQMPGIQDAEKVKKVVGSVAKLDFRLVSAQGESGMVLKGRDGSTYTVEDEVLISGDAVETASAHFLNGQMEVLLSFTPEGGRLFREVTEKNVGRQLAIILDNVVYSAPQIREKIGGGSASITGQFTAEEANQLGIVLRAGALPASLTVVEERTVGPTLGRASIEKGAKAILVGITFIFIFMAIYYKRSGVLAGVTLVLNAFFVLALLSAFGATLTLPGLAGLALTVGMAVDSNVIIFERIRDELRNGASPEASVASGFDKAWSAIADANFTTLISAIILFILGSGPIRGFAVTLAVGILTTMYCAVSVTRLGFDVLPLKTKKGLSI